MLRALPDPLSERKLLLAGVAACRAAWDLFTDDRCHAAVEVVERFADGAASIDELADAERQSSAARDLAIGPAGTAPRLHRTRRGRCTSWAAHALAIVRTRDELAAHHTREDVVEALAQLQDARRGRYRATRKTQVQLVRDVFGSPFRRSPSRPPGGPPPSAASPAASTPSAPSTGCRSWPTPSKTPAATAPTCWPTAAATAPTSAAAGSSI